jgi:hypothetical protein
MIYLNLYNFLKDLDKKSLMINSQRLSFDQIKLINQNEKVKLFHNYSRKIFVFEFVFYNITGIFVAIYPAEMKLSADDEIGLYYLDANDLERNFQEPALSLLINP